MESLRMSIWVFFMECSDLEYEMVGSIIENTLTPLGYNYPSVTPLVYVYIDLANAWKNLRNPLIDGIGVLLGF